MSVVFSSVTVDTKCPSGTIKIDQNVQLRSDVTVTAKNSGAEAATIIIEIETKDDEGNRKFDTETFDLKAGKQDTRSFVQYFITLYEKAGTKNVTGTVKARATTGGSKNGNDICSFKVT